ncbi:unnamed protein product [Mytilus edulis]|uniref:Uncharacterized protein n=1 Tax=Mytilus edulis TaxID=6550 RepID=A0A8S3SPD2_MYTED|nr:unnamed protein product [Mytilus edulis]
MCLYLVTDSSIGEDCVRLRPDTLVRDTSCNNQYVTVCQRAASLETSSLIDITSSQEITTTNKKASEGQTTTEKDLFGTTSTHLSTETETFVESSTSYIRQSEVSTTVSTTKEPVSTIEGKTKVVLEKLSTALKVSSQVSPVASKTTEHLQIPTQTTKYADAATAPQTHTQTNRLRPTTISSPIENLNVRSPLPTLVVVRREQWLILLKTKKCKL